MEPKKKPEVTKEDILNLPVHEKKYDYIPAEVKEKKRPRTDLGSD